MLKWTEKGPQGQALSHCVTWAMGLQPSELPSPSHPRSPGDLLVHSSLVPTSHLALHSTQLPEENKRFLHIQVAPTQDRAGMCSSPCISHMRKLRHKEINLTSMSVLGSHPGYPLFIIMVLGAYVQLQQQRKMLCPSQSPHSQSQAGSC